MILCAALKLHDSLSDIILPCHRHHDGYHILRDLDVDWKQFEITQGFITSSGDFLDRVEAYTEAKRCGQISAQARHDKAMTGVEELFSEDLY